MKIASLFVVIAFTIFMFGCKDRTEKFLDDYAVAEVVEIGDEGYQLDNHFEYLAGHTYKNTKEAIQGQMKQLVAASDSTLAIANVFNTSSDGLAQCIIVHRSEPSQLTITHELGHCFHLVFFEKLESKAPEILKLIDENQNGHRYLLESFADVAASTIAFDVDGDKSYLEGRIKKYKGRNNYPASMKPYVESVPLLESLGKFLETAELPDKPKAQVEFILDEFYLNPKYNNRLVVQ